MRTIKLRYLIIIVMITSLIIFSISPISSLSFSGTCLAGERVTPYKPEVKYIKPKAIKEKPKKTPEIELHRKKRIWPWVVGGAVVAASIALLADKDKPEDSYVDVDVSW